MGITSPYPRENIIASNYILADMQAYLDMHIPQELRIRSRGTERHSASN